MRYNGTTKGKNAYNSIVRQCKDVKMSDRTFTFFMCVIDEMYKVRGYKRGSRFGSLTDGTPPVLIHTISAIPDDMNELKEDICWFVEKYITEDTTRWYTVKKVTKTVARRVVGDCFESLGIDDEELIKSIDIKLGCTYQIAIDDYIERNAKYIVTDDADDIPQPASERKKKKPKRDIECYDGCDDL